MSPFVGLPLFLVLGTLEAWLAHALAPLTVLRPDLLLTSAIACGLLGGYRAGLAWGAVAGLIFDLLSAGPVGAGLLPMTLVGLASGLAQGRSLLLSSRLLPLQAALVGTVVFDLIYMLLLQLSGWGFSLIIAIYEVALPSALLNALLMPAVYGVFYWLWQRARSGREYGY